MKNKNRSQPISYHPLQFIGNSFYFYVIEICRLNIFAPTRNLLINRPGIFTKSSNTTDKDSNFSEKKFPFNSSIKKFANSELVSLIIKECGFIDHQKQSHVSTKPQAFTF